MALKLHYRELGPEQKPAADLVIAHGLFGSVSNWQTVARRLAARYRVLLVDLRNHGESPHSDIMDYPSMAGDLAEFIDSHCAGPAHLVGHSMGGKAAMATALLHPQVVRSLVAVDIAPVARLSGFDAFAEALGSIPLDRIQSRSDADGHLQPVIPEPGIRAFLLQNLRRDEQGRWYWRINLPIIANALPVIAAFPDTDATWSGPALFLRGGLSGYVTDHDFEAAKIRFPGARLETIAGTGHWLHAEKPAEVASAIESFVAKQ